MRREILKRRGLAVLLAHEQHRKEWREDDHRRRESQFLGRYERGHAIAMHPISNLIVVLREHNKLRAAGGLRLRAVLASAINRMLPSVAISTRHHARQIARGAVSNVVARLLGGQECVQCMMEIVAPL